MRPPPDVVCDVDSAAFPLASSLAYESFFICCFKGSEMFNVASGGWQLRRGGNTDSRRRIREGNR